MPYDAVVVGSGPNGLTAAITLARAGWKVAVFEASSTLGGGTKTLELTLPGFDHDVCSAVHPLAVASPVFQSFPLAAHGLQWVYPPIAVAHPLDDGSAVVLRGSVENTAGTLGADERSYQRLMGPLVRDWGVLCPEFLTPVHVPVHPLALARFGMDALCGASALARAVFRTERARALFAGLAAHSRLPLEQAGAAAVGLVLGMAGHAVGWPIPKGGSGRLAAALCSYLESLGGQLFAGSRVDSIADLPGARAVVCDVSPKELLRIAGDRLPRDFRRRLGKYRYGPGAFKVDWALDRPIPWRAPECFDAATVHVGGTLGEIAESERNAWTGRHSARPFVLLCQPTVFDHTRAPAGKHPAWAYCHVPNGWTMDMVERIEAQIERFAPGFRKRILARHVFSPADFEAANPNIVGGDINGGAQDLGQLFFRPTRMLYRTPAKGLYICSASTPPGGGVHGMCGYWAAQSVLRDFS